MRSFSLIFKHFSRSFLLIAGFAVLGFSAYAQGDAAKGEALFKAKCSTCHKVDQQLVGPALGPQLTEETDDKFLIKWIENNQALIAAHDQKATTIYNKFNQSNMTVFTELSDADAASIITYVRGDWKTMQAAKAAPAPGQAAAESGPSDLVIYALIGIIILAFIIILVLNKVISTLERVLLKNQGLVLVEAEEKEVVDKYATLKKFSDQEQEIGIFCAFSCYRSFIQLDLGYFMEYQRTHRISAGTTD